MDDFSKRSKRRIVARLIEKGLPKENASSEYQAIWDETLKWIQDGKPAESESFPPGGKWIAKDLYEVNGLIYKMPDQWKFGDTYEGSQSSQEYQHKERLKRLLRNAPTMNEARVVELMSAAEFAEFPDDLKQALSDRMLQLEIEPD